MKPNSSTMMRPSRKPPWDRSTSDHAAATKSNEIKHNESSREKHQRPLDGHSVSVHSSVAQRKSKSRTFRIRLKPKLSREHHLAKITSSHHDKNDGKKHHVSLRDRSNSDHAATTENNEIKNDESSSDKQQPIDSHSKSVHSAARRKSRSGTIRFRINGKIHHQVSATTAKNAMKVLARAFAPYSYAAKLTEDYISILEECNPTNPQFPSSIEQTSDAQDHIKFIQDRYECSEDLAKFIVRQRYKNIFDILTSEFGPKADQLMEKYLKVYTTNPQPTCVSGTNDKQRNEITKIQKKKVTMSL